MNFLFRSNFRGITSIFVLITENKKYIESRWVSKTSGTPGQGSLDKVLVVGKLFKVIKTARMFSQNEIEIFIKKKKSFQRLFENGILIPINVLTFVINRDFKSFI